MVRLEGPENPVQYWIWVRVHHHGTNHHQLSFPKYRLHKARNCAVVTVDGRDHYLGIFGSPQSWEQYHRLVAESLAVNTRAASTILPLPADAPLTVTELIAKYWLYSKA